MAVDPRSKTGIDWDAQPLGDVSDSEIARQLGVSQHSVRSARVVRWIAPWRTEDRARGIQWDRVLSDGTRIPLGRVRDQDIADWLGVTVGTVAKARRLRGIRAWRDLRR